MKRFIRTLSVNTVLKHSVHISISYFSLTRNGSPKYLDSLWIRHGALVIQIRNVYGHPLHRMLRDTLIALTVFPSFIDVIEKSRRSDVFHSVLRNARLSKLLSPKKTRKYSISRRVGHMNKLLLLIINQLIKRKIRFSDKIKKFFRIITTKISSQTLRVL